MRIHKPLVVALLKSRIFGGVADGVYWRHGVRNWIHVEASGFNGGIWVLWNKDEISMIVLYANK